MVDSERIEWKQVKHWLLWCCLRKMSTRSGSLEFDEILLNMMCLQDCHRYFMTSSWMELNYWKILTRTDWSIIEYYRYYMILPYTILLLCIKIIIINRDVNGSWIILDPRREFKIGLPVGVELPALGEQRHLLVRCHGWTCAVAIFWGLKQVRIAGICWSVLFGHPSILKISCR